MKLSEKVFEICSQYYVKHTVCFGCPIYSACHNGRSFPYTSDGNNAYIQAINDQADKVVLRF
jgi:hypothetical protein